MLQPCTPIHLDLCPNPSDLVPLCPCYNTLSHQEVQQDSMEEGPHFLGVPLGLPVSSLTLLFCSCLSPPAFEAVAMQRGVCDARVLSRVKISLTPQAHLQKYVWQREVAVMTRDDCTGFGADFP